MLTSAHNDDDVLRLQRSWRQVFMDTCAKHRANRLKGMSPLAPLVATRFRGPPTEMPLGLSYSTLYGGGPFPTKMAMPAPSWGMPPGSVYSQPMPPGFGPTPGSLPVPWAQPSPMPMTRMAAPPQPYGPFGIPPPMGPPGMALPRPVMPPLGMQPPTRMAQPPQGDLLGAPPPATLPAPLQPSRGGVQKGGCHLQ
jgi:hypothetical protein